MKHLIRLNRIILFLLLTSVCLSLHAQDHPIFSVKPSADVDELPWIYYRSPERDGYLIERVDGMESRAITTKDRPADDRSVGGPGWSPSGEWFAWTSGDNYNGGHQAETIWITRQGITRQLELPGRLPYYTADAHWRRGVDQLITYYETGGPDSERRAAFIDPDSGEVTTYDAAPVWSFDQQWFYFLHYDYDSEMGYQHRLVLGGPDGSLTERLIETSFGCRDDLVPLHDWSPTGELISVSPTGKYIVFEDMSAGTFSLVPLPAPYVHRIQWRADGQYALLQIGAACDNVATGSQLWLLNRATGALTLVSDTLSYQYGAMDDGPPTYNEENEWTRRARWSPWSPDGRYVVYWTKTGVLIYDIVQGRSFDTGIATTPFLEHFDIKAMWLPDSHGIAVQWDTKLWVSALESGQAILIADGINSFELSPDGRFVAVASLQACDGEFACIYTTAGQRFSMIPRHSGAVDTWGYVSFQWHPTAPWLFVSYATDGTPHNMAVNVSGTIRRELNRCYLGDGCMGWLPETIDPLEWGTAVTLPRLPDAEIYLGAEPYIGGGVFDAAWSPDETRIAAVTGREIHILDAETLFIQLTIPIAEGHSSSWVLWDPDGEHVLVGSRRDDYGPLSGGARETVTRYALSERAAQVIGTVTGLQVLVNDTVIVVRREDAKTIDVLRRDTFSVITSLADGAAIALSENNRLAMLDQVRGSVFVWQIEPDALAPLTKLAMFPNLIDEEELPGLTYANHWHKVFLSRRGEWVSEGGSPIWNVDTQTRLMINGVLVSTMTDQTDYILQRINEENKRFISLISPTTGETLTQIATPEYEDSHVLYVSRDSSWLIYGDTQSLTLWDAAEAEVRSSWIAWRRYEPAPVAVSRDEERLALSVTRGSLETIEVYDLTHSELPLIDHVNRQAELIVWNDAGTRFVAFTGSSLSLVVVDGD